MSDNPLAKLGELTKPATVLIEKISDAVGGVFKPYQIVRVARAEAEAEKIRTESQIQITDLQRRAMHRFLEEEAKRQSNIEGITGKAIPLLEEKSSPEKVERDWITNFFDKCRIVSDEEMQTLWSRVLAGEANHPGSFARRTVNLLADLDKDDAVLFVRLCGFGWAISDMMPLVFNVREILYNAQGIHFESLTHLDSLGLIKFDASSGFRWVRAAKRCTVSYYGKSLDLVFPNDADNSLDLGKVILTQQDENLLEFVAPDQ